MGADGRKRFREQPPAVLINRVDDLFQRFFGGSQVVKLSLQVCCPRFQFAQLLKRVEIDASQPSQLTPQLRDLLVNDQWIKVIGEWRVVSGDLTSHSCRRFGSYSTDSRLLTPDS